MVLAGFVTVTCHAGARVLCACYLELVTSVSLHAVIRGAAFVHRRVRRSAHTAMRQRSQVGDAVAMGLALTSGYERQQRYQYYQRCWA